MSSSAVTTLAWLGLAGVVALGVAVAWLYRRTETMVQAYSDAKWDLVALRAEVGSLRRQLRAATGAPAEPPSLEEARVPPGADDAARNGRGRTASPTAWRRERTRSGPGRPRRRRPG